ncbi:MAG: DUF883 domain-containing protein [Burkholderiales bacterium]|nr:MAG: DUF883 domain-containing protein [Burkholderiales bacterium]
MSTMNPGIPSGSQSERNGNGSIGVGGPTRTDSGGGSEFGAFLDDLSELARGTGHGDLRGELERRVSQARGRMTEALDQGVEMSHRAREQMRRGIDYSRDTVTERPLSALTVAAVGGLIVGLLLSRRH